MKDKDVVYCEECNWGGYVFECDTNGDADSESTQSFLECPTKGCMGTIIEN